VPNFGARASKHVKLERLHFIASTMRLIDTTTLRLHEFFGDDIPSYAILSHTWGKEETSFQEWQAISADSKEEEDCRKAFEKSAKKGILKILGACKEAKSYGFNWLWADTNCIDKTSSAELSEAINSMFQWYARSGRCYVHLSDVSMPPSGRFPEAQFRNSRWFTRGWTLQELLAPENITFYAETWDKLAGLGDFVPADDLTSWVHVRAAVSQVTGIALRRLGTPLSSQGACISEKMAWLARRKTTRIEDMSYCMLGLLDINMPLLYGEGAKAFTRLQHELIRSSNDHTIFCWSRFSNLPEGWTSFLAPSPQHFLGLASEPAIDGENRAGSISMYSMTNAGLSITLPVLYTPKGMLVILEAVLPFPAYSRDAVMAIFVRGDRIGETIVITGGSLVPQPEPILVQRSLCRAAKNERLLVKDLSNKMRWWMQSALAIPGPPPPPSTTTTELWRRPGNNKPEMAAILAWDSQSLESLIAINFRHTSFAQVPPLYAKSDCVKLKVTEKMECFIGTALLDGLACVGHIERGTQRTKYRQIHVFVALKIIKATGVIHPFCQVFVSGPFPDRRPRVRQHESLENLRKQVLDADWEQPAHYSPVLRASVFIDVTNTLPVERQVPELILPCVRISLEHAGYEKGTVKMRGVWQGCIAETAGDSDDGGVATRSNDGPNVFQQYTPFPETGRLHDEALESGFDELLYGQEINDRHFELAHASCSSS